MSEMNKTIGLITANYYSDALSDATITRPLSALPFAGRYRLIDFPLSNMVNSNISTVGLIMPFNNRSLIDHVGTGKSWGFGRKTHSLFMLPGSLYGRRSKSSIFLLRDVKDNLRFFTYENADYILMTASNRVYSMDYRPMIEAHANSSSPVTMLYKGKEFMDCMIIDLSFLSDMVDWFSNIDFMGIPELLDKYMPECPVQHYEFIGYEHLIYTQLDYYEASMDLLKETTNHMIFNSNGTIFTNIQDRCPTFFAPTAKVKNSIIAAGCTIEGDVEDSIIFRSSHIAQGATVKKSILMQHAEVESDADLKYFICDKRVTITSGSKIYGTKESPFFAKKGTTI